MPTGLEYLERALNKCYLKVEGYNCVESADIVFKIAGLFKKRIVVDEKATVNNINNAKERLGLAEALDSYPTGYRTTNNTEQSCAKCYNLLFAASRPFVTDWRCKCCTGVGITTCMYSETPKEPQKILETHTCHKHKGTKEPL